MAEGNWFDRLVLTATGGADIPVVGVLRLTGIIGAGSIGAFRRGLSAAALAGPIERAFSLPNLQAVALVINSPGGSPVQSSLIARRIRDLADERNVPVYAFVEDVAASGGYWLALAADQIYADASSIVGSIGVISAGFGLHRLIEKLGVDRRVYATGARKGMLDPFRPEDPDEVEHFAALQGDVYDTFKEYVRLRRAPRLKETADDLFSGAFWSGRRALDLGLIDGLGDLRNVLRDRFGKTVRLWPVSTRPGWLRRGLWPWVRRYPDGAIDAFGGALAAIEEQLYWSRFGL